MDANPGPSRKNQESAFVEDQYMKHFLANSDDYQNALENEDTAVEQTEYHDDSEEEDDNEVETSKLHMKPGRKLGSHIESLIGNANILLAKGNLESAEKVCYEIIRQNASVAAPYKLLGEIFENSWPEKAMEYFVFAALCSKRDSDLWEKCGQMALEKHMPARAIVCFTKAISCKPENINLHLKRIRLLRLQGDMKNMLRAYVKMMKHMTMPEFHEYLVSLSERVAREYSSLKDYKKALDVLSVPFDRCRNLITPDMINIMLELLIITENYTKALDVFLEFCNIETQLFIDTEGAITIENFKMPEGIQIDLKTKFVICVIRLKSFHLLDELLKPFLEMETEEVDTKGDLFLDIIENLMDFKMYEAALKVLVPLIKSRNYSLAAVWLKYGDCQNKCNLLEQAVDSYKTVMQLAPFHVDVRHSLAEVLIKLDRKLEAIKLLNIDKNVFNEEHIAILLLRIELLKEHQHYDDYFKAMEFLLSRHCVILRHKSEIRLIMYNESPAEKRTRLKKLRESFKESYEPDGKFVASSKTPSVEEEFQLFREALQLAKDLRKYSIMQKLAITALTSYRFKSRYQQIFLWAFYASVLNNDFTHALPIIREFLIRCETTNKLVWNLFNLLLQVSSDVRSKTFMMRFLASYPDDSYSRFIQANYFLTFGNIKVSLVTYFTNLQASNPNPLNYLLLCACMLHIVNQKYRQNKKKVMNAAFAYMLKYCQARSKDAIQEINYNMGCFYQHIGLHHLANKYYKLVLLDDTVSSLNLKFEAAFNLRLMYLNSDNRLMALQTTNKYLRF